jgi:hypothetical protein
MCIGKYNFKIISYYVQDAASLEVPSPYVKVYLVESTFGRNKRDMYSKKKTRFATPEVEIIKKKHRGGGICKEKKYLDNFSD